jgi:hypothetical protein
MAECPVCKTAIANTAMRSNENRAFQAWLWSARGVAILL